MIRKNISNIKPEDLFLRFEFENEHGEKYYSIFPVETYRVTSNPIGTLGISSDGLPGITWAKKV